MRKSMSMLDMSALMLHLISALSSMQPATAPVEGSSVCHGQLNENGVLILWMNAPLGVGHQFVMFSMMDMSVSMRDERCMSMLDMSSSMRHFIIVLLLKDWPSVCHGGVSENDMLILWDECPLGFGHRLDFLSMQIVEATRRPRFFGICSS